MIANPKNTRVKKQEISPTTTTNPTFSKIKTDDTITQGEPEEEIDECQLGYQKISNLEKYGLTKKDTDILRSYGHNTIESVMMVTKRKIMSYDGISEAKATKILIEVRKLMDVGFTKADKVLEQRQNLIKIRTGSRQLDRILGGGIETGSMTEVFGESGSGKSQLCHTLAVNCQLPADEGGGEGRCLWLDTEGTFRTERIVEISDKLGLNFDCVLDNISVARIFNTQHQMDMMVQASALLAASKYSLVIVDSVINLFRNEFSGRGELADRQMALNRFLRHLMRLSCEYGVAVVMTNQVCATVDGSAVFGAPDKVGSGGHVLAHACQTRISFDKTKKKGKKMAKLFQSPLLPEAECFFAIADGGLEDYEKE
uniref:DNA repair protein RAD51 homolog n=1 Tax=Rhabditophanes sp. KR3021 TaxID=114890 RepID=A0AC35TJ77_9BILA